MDIFKKSKSETELPNMDGWKCIEKAFSDVYPNQDNPKHYGTLIPFSLGGNSPLDGICVHLTKEKKYDIIESWEKTK